jgi:hypothetical protein
MPLHAVDQFEDAYMEAFWAAQRAQWSVYAGEPDEQGTTATHGHDAAVAVLQEDLPDTRRAHVLRLAAQRDAVELDPDIRSLRNKLDAGNDYDTGLGPHETAHRMTPDVLRLMDLRSTAARAAGFASYPAVALAAEEIDGRWLLRFLEEFLQAKLTEARSLVTTWQLDLSNWFRRLDAAARPPVPAEPAILWQKLMNALGLGTGIPQPRVCLLSLIHISEPTRPY